MLLSLDCPIIQRDLGFGGLMRYIKVRYQNVKLIEDFISTVFFLVTHIALRVVLSWSIRCLGLSIKVPFLVKGMSILLADNHVITVVEFVK